MTFRLTPIGRDGQLAPDVQRPPSDVLEICRATKDHHDRVGFHPPWIGYLALEGGEVVGGGGFVGPPEGGRVEIAYFTRPERQSQGYATRTAAALIAIAREAEPGLAIWAKTLPEPGPSPSVLARLGFVRDGVAIDHEIGEAWAWLLP